MKVKSNVKAGAISVKVDFHAIAAVETTSSITVGHSRRRRMLLKINDLSYMAFVNLKSIESTIYAFYATGNGQVLN